MDFFRRIGTDRHKYKVQFFLKKLKCSAKLKGEVYVTIKRGDHKITTDKKFPMQDDGSLDFENQILTFQALTLFYDADEKKYQEKQGEIRLIILTKKGDKKLLGNIEFDVAQFANSGKETSLVEKKFGDKIKITFEFQVYVKCLGQASQSTQSVSKNDPKLKKQSSLSKFVSFFTGQPTEKEKSEAEVQSLKDKILNERPPLKKQKSVQKSTKKPIKPLTDERVNKIKRKSPENSEEDSEEDYRNQTKRGRKNLVATKNKTLMTENHQQKTSNNNTPNNHQKNLNKFYFDDVSSFKKQPQNKQIQLDNVRMQLKLQQQKKENQKNLDKKLKEKQKQFKQKQRSYENALQQKDKQILSFQTTIKNLQKQNRKLEQNVTNLNLQKIKLQQALKSKNNISIDHSDNIFETQRQLSKRNENDNEQRVKQLQREKGDLLCKLQKLDEKYNKDFRKYEQIVDKYEQEKLLYLNQGKGQVKKLKQQLNLEKSKSTKAISKYEEMNNQIKLFKLRENQLKDRLALTMNDLSKIKLKIGDLVNQANQTGNQSMIDALTQLQ